MKRFSIHSAFAALAVVVPTAAFAHPGHPGAGFGAGFMHPLSGADHLLAMIAVGFWAAMLGGRARLLVPAAFVSVMLSGAVFGIFGASIPMVEPTIAASVVVLGLLVAFDVKVPLAVASAVVAAAAFFHGFAHGAELPENSRALSYVGGFVAATILLHIVGLALGRLRMSNAGRMFGRMAGAITALAGFALLAG
ncbi:HupE/UreJ family protein [Rhizobium sp. L1K21]|uniref:HupE/UreJ family protein n=1 Tax=Rhizobium sp. L1K21 TaxID=2954933 RepID=UPI002092E8EF|nr:HupE/UreJ family protein [Rhizobium sp. L1K21]MCO6184609.1 HupE/UreJ family protein [Rhizobium sp. L1K21]